jgi:aryl-alcohol dehydrogenase-like predicted oxidoreductase
VLAGLDAGAKSTGATQASIALAWLISRPEVTGPIVSATELAQLSEFTAAAGAEARRGGARQARSREPHRRLTAR